MDWASGCICEFFDSTIFYHSLFDDRKPYQITLAIVEKL